MTAGAVQMATGGRPPGGFGSPARRGFPEFGCAAALGFCTEASEVKEQSPAINPVALPVHPSGTATGV